MDSDISILRQSLDDFNATQRALMEDLSSALRSLDRAFGAMDGCVKDHTSQLNEYHEMRRMFEQIKSQGSGGGGGGGGGGSGEGGGAGRGQARGSHAQARLATLEELEVQLLRAKESLDRLQESKPKTGSFFLTLMLGHVNVRAWRTNDAIKQRDEYNKFKRWTTYCFILFPLAQLVMGFNSSMWRVHQLWLCYYYLSLAMRENILRVNGSNIAFWWLLHHYLTLGISVVSLLFPASTETWALHFNWFLFIQGLVMLVQNKYQARRHYARRALGKANDVDVEATETLVEKPTDLKVLVPLLYIIYVYEVFFGVYIVTLLPFISAFIVGVLFVLIGVGNAVTTGKVLFEKRKRRLLRQKF